MVCGFDLLRIGGSGDKAPDAFVIDVNGWSFVKDNDEYYQKCAETLRAMFYAAARERANRSVRPLLSTSPSHPAPPNEGRAWKIKGFIVVLRHADRTPKQKFKFSVRSQSFLRLVQGYNAEILLRDGQLAQYSPPINGLT